MSIPRNGLVYEYLMETINGSTLVDTSGAGRDGTITGATQVTGANSIGNGLEIDNANAGATPTEYVDVPYNNFGTGNFTVGAWLKLYDDSRHHLVGYRATQGYGGVYPQCGGNCPAFTFDASYPNYPSATYYLATSPNNVSPNTWFHFAIRRSSSTGIEFFINGTKLGDTVTIPSSGYFDVNILGAVKVGSGLYTHMAGVVDCFRAYNRSLSDAEITSLAQENDPSILSPNEGVSDSIADATLALTQNHVLSVNDGVSDSIGDVVGSLSSPIPQDGVSDSICDVSLALTQVHILSGLDCHSDGIYTSMTDIVMQPQGAVSDSISEIVGIEYFITQADFVADIVESPSLLAGDWNRIADLTCSDVLEATFYVMQIFGADIGGQEDILVADFNVSADLEENLDTLSADLVMTISLGADLVSLLDQLAADIIPSTMFNGDLVEPIGSLGATMDTHNLFSADLFDVNTLSAFMVVGTVFIGDLQEPADVVAAVIYVSAQFEAEIVLSLDMMSAEMTCQNRFDDVILQHSRWR